MAILKYKKITSKRGVNLNKDICAYVDLKAGDPIDVTAQDDGTVLIRKHMPQCRFCGDRKESVTVMGIDVCPNCAEKLCAEVIKKAGGAE